VSLACRARGGGRASIATWLFIAFAASCAAAASGAPTVAASGPSEPPPGVAPLEPASALAHDGGAACGEPSCCPHGALVDPHRGFVRCLAAGEDAGPGAPRDAGDAGSSDAGDAGDAGSSDAGDAGSGDAGDAAPAGVPAVAEVKTIKLQGGEIPKHEKTIGALMAGVAKCVSEHGGLTAKAGSLKLELLVRARGKAEGVEVRELKGAGAAAATCVRTHVRGRTIGTPTSDPVGVTVQIELKKK
jgi:hypothetical protein